MDSNVRFWMTAAFGASLITVAVVFAVAGTGEKATVIALQAVARIAFLLFLAAYAGGPLATLLGPRFDGLSRHGRDFGLAFAAALSVHLGLVVWFCYVTAHPLHASRLIIAELIGAAWIYILAGFSIKRLRDAISPDLWRLMRTLGMDYVALIFAYNFALAPTTLKNLPFLLLAIGGLILRIIAALRYWRRTNSTAWR
jgi:hypothetical protein